MTRLGFKNTGCFSSTKNLATFLPKPLFFAETRRNPYFWPKFTETETECSVGHYTKWHKISSGSTPDPVLGLIDVSKINVIHVNSELPTFTLYTYNLLPLTIFQAFMLSLILFTYLSKICVIHNFSIHSFIFPFTI